MSFQIEDRGNGIKWVRVSNRHMYDIARWCQEHGCGKQVSIHAISFKNEEELTMFLLRWQGEFQ
jgi:hypothetical protein